MSRVRTLTFTSIVLLVATAWALLFAPSASAMDVTVGCPSGQPGQFASITDALNSLDQLGPHTIIVSGTCTETLFIADRDGVTITAPDGQMATINPASSQDVVVHLFRAHRMLLNNLVIQGGSIGVIVSTGSDALIENCLIQNNSGDGLHPQQNATVVVQSSTMQKNGGTGLTVASDSNVTLSTFPDQRIHINENGFAGINVDGGYLQVNFGTVTVENNGGPAILADGGRLLIFGDSPLGTGAVFENNGEGIDLFNGTRATLWGQITVRNNGSVGLQVDGSSVQFFGGALPDGSPDGMLVEGHTTLGVNITGSAEVIISGAHKIRRNGSADADSQLRSGLRVSRASATLNGGTQIANNVGPAVLADFNSSVQIGPDVSLAGNTGGGARLLHMSVGNLIAPFRPNQSVTCDETSLVFGDLPGKGFHCHHSDGISSSLAAPRGLKR